MIKNNSNNEENSIETMTYLQLVDAYIRQTHNVNSIKRKIENNVDSDDYYLDYSDRYSDHYVPKYN